MSYEPIADHSIIGDLHSVALVGEERQHRLVLLTKIWAVVQFGSLPYEI